MIEIVGSGVMALTYAAGRVTWVRYGSGRYTSSWDELLNFLAFGFWLGLANQLRHSLLGLGFAAAVGAVMLLSQRERKDTDSDTCGKCGHDRVDHHGPCQACLRAVQNMDAVAPSIPCGKFAIHRARTTKPATH